MRFKNIWHILLVLLMISPNVHAEGNPAKSITAACNTLTRLQSGQDGQSASGQKQLYMSLRTNMLYDALAVPNISAEIYLGRNWSVSAGWMHAWWSYDRRHRYWRIYGGEINGRYWFGPAAHNKPLTGHHVGLYLQALTYDFEFGGKAYMGGEPGGTILDRAHIGGGIEYGYTKPIGRRLNLDFSIGIGYIGGRLYEFIPEDDHYLWSATKNKRWFGPTKLEISLVWLIGRHNINKPKGGDL